MNWPNFLVVVLVMITSVCRASTDDAVYMDATNSEISGDYETALLLYKQYLRENPNSHLVAPVSTRVSVITEATRFGIDGALPLYLDALNARDDRRVEDAENSLIELVQQFPDSYLLDDALYLRGYIALMDNYEFETAHLLMRRLQTEYPESSYLDTALYSEAIALEQLGNTDGAYDRFSVLRERHTQFALSLFGTMWPKSTYLSRYWFDRSNNRMKMLDDRQDGAAQLVAKNSSGSISHAMSVNVMVDGQQLVLLLSPSPVVKTTQFRDDADRELELADTRLYAGEVQGIADSWARVRIRGNSIEGVVKTPSQSFELKPDSMIGTIDYYQSRSKARSDESTIALQDYAMHPPVNLEERIKAVTSEPELGAAIAGNVSKLLRMDIVVDSQYDDYFGGNGLIEAMSNLNVADGIYRENFGMAIEVGSATVFGQRTADPMNLGAVTLETTLRAFRDYRMSTSKPADIGLTYLFSGNRNVDEAIGLAWIGAVCRSDGFDVGVTTPTSYGDLLVTHELGHSMGAQHDTDTACKSNSNFLMWPRISATTEQSFTSCSTQTVNTGVNKSCLQDTIDVSLQLESNGNTGFSAKVLNNDLFRAANGASLVLDSASVDRNQLPDNCTDNSSSEMICAIGSLQPGESKRFSFYLAANTSEANLLATLKPTGFYDVKEKNNVARLDLERTADGTAVWASVSEDSTGSSGGTSSASGSGNTATSGGTDASSTASSGGGGATVWLLAGSLFSVGFRLLPR